MSRRTPPERVEIYRHGQSIKNPSIESWPFAEAQLVANQARGIFRDKRRKFVLFDTLTPEPSESPNSQSSLGPRDAEALAGAIPMSARRRERLVGWAPKRGL